MHLIDTNVAIYLRDSNEQITSRVNELPTRPAISLLSWVELEGGVHAHPAFAASRRERLDALLELLEVVLVDATIVRAYARIIAQRGFSRPRVLDRLIAATAIVNDLTLITINAADSATFPASC